MSSWLSSQRHNVVSPAHIWFPGLPITSTRPLITLLHCCHVAFSSDAWNIADFLWLNSSLSVPASDACKLVQQSSASSRGFLATFWCSCSQTPECVSPLPLRASQPLCHDLHEWACSKPDHFILFSNPTDPEHWIQIPNFWSCYFIDEYIGTCLHCLG